MDIQSIISLIEKNCGKDAILSVTESGLQPSLLINPDVLVQVCCLLRDHETTYFDFLSCLSGVDYGEKAAKIGVVYHLSSIPYGKQLCLKVEQSFDAEKRTAQSLFKLSPETDLSILPTFPSVAEVWKSAEWHEREAFDLLGIYFLGNEDMRRILLPDDWEGFPLRKDYQPAASYDGIQIAWQAPAEK